MVHLMSSKPRVAVIGIGVYGPKHTIPDLSFRELAFEAALRAYRDAGLEDPRRDIDAFISCQEDFWEGIAIADEFAPEPIGGVLRPTFTVSGDGLQGVAQAYMLIRTGYFDVVAVEAHAKPSDIKTFDGIMELAFDPNYLRPVVPPNYHFLAALEARAFMEYAKATREDLALVVAKNKNAGLHNPRAIAAAPLTPSDVLEAPMVSDPLTAMDIADPVDAAVVVVLASDDAVKRLGAEDRAVWIEGIGYYTETGSFERHELGRAPSIRMAAARALSDAGISNPFNEIDFVETEDRYSFMEPLSLLEAGISEDPIRDLREGTYNPGGPLPVNVSGGSLSWGWPLEATGLLRLVHAVEMIRAGRGEKGLVISWRGIPTYTSSAVVVSSGG
jgi:acetyl-CoA C-acetyltransferase